MDMLELALNPKKVNRRFSPFSNAMPEGMVRRLEYQFGDRASADPNELFLASKDAASPPPALNLALKRKAWGVVAAKTRGELRALIEWANHNFIPIVPRGAGTSGYGGAVPTEGGVVVDLRPMNALVSVDKKEMTVTVEPGMRFWELERLLNKEGLALRQYPTSARGSTVGGWVATGGGGVGSLKFGPFRNDVVRVEILAPDGKQRVLEAEDLNLVHGAWGITGFIVEATLRVRVDEPVTPMLAEWDNPAKAAEAAERLAGTGTGWHLAFNPAEYSQLVNEAAKVRLLPNKTNILFCAIGDASEAEGRFRAIVEDTGGSVAKPEAAKKAWDARFDHLNVKRLGPSVVVSEAVLDVSRLGEGLRAAESAVKAERQAMWGIMISPREMDLIYYGLEEERRPEYATALGNSLAFLDAVKDLGGRSYNTGVLLANESKAVLGEDRVKLLKQFKKETDPNDVFNPGPVLGARMRGAPIRIFPFFMNVNAPALKMLRGAFHYRGGEKQDPSFQAVRRVVGESGARDLAALDYEVNTCIFCANCNDVAPEASFVHWETATPRGRVQAARAILAGRSEPTRHLQEQASQNPLSYAPDAVCPTIIPIARVTDLLLAACVDRLGPLPAHAELAESAAKEGNVLGKPRDKRNAWAAALPWDTEARTLFFADDIASYDATDVAGAAARILVNADVRLNYLAKAEVTSGAPLVETGQRAAAAEVLKDVFNALVSRKIDLVVSPDANAIRVVKNDWPALAAVHDVAWAGGAMHTSEAIASYLKAKRLEVATKWEKKVVYHAPEALDGKSRDAGVEVLKALGAKLVATTPLECGHGRGLDKTRPDMQQKIAERALRAALDAGAEAIVCANPGCYTVLKSAAKKAKVALEVVDLHDVVAKSMKLREGGGAVAVAAAPAEPEVAAEPEIPPDHFRVEFVKEKKVVAVHKNANLLDAALEAGMELPFSCRAGSCDTCSAKWEGVAPDQSAGAALTAEQQKTFVLTCIARPKGPVKIWSEEKP